MLNKEDLEKLLKQLEQERKSIEYSKLINDSAIDEINEEIMALTIEQENNK